jgi:hypothetical protein
MGKGIAGQAADIVKLRGALRSINEGGGMGFGILVLLILRSSNLGGYEQAKRQSDQNTKKKR